MKLCKSCKKNEVPTLRSRFCDTCATARRVYQLKINNEKWQMRIELGQASHRIMYKGQPTKWALEHPVDALKEALKEGFKDEDLEVLIQALRSAESKTKTG